MIMCRVIVWINSDQLVYAEGIYDVHAAAELNQPYADSHTEQAFMVLCLRMTKPTQDTLTLRWQTPRLSYYNQATLRRC